MEMSNQENEKRDPPPTFEVHIAKDKPLDQPEALPLAHPSSADLSEMPHPECVSDLTLKEVQDYFYQSYGPMVRKLGPRVWRDGGGYFIFVTNQPENIAEVMRREFPRAVAAGYNNILLVTPSDPTIKHSPMVMVCKWTT
jgi:hypothetical protein